MSYQTLDDLITAAGWFHGDMADWRALDAQEQSRQAFAATGCLLAYPTWNAPCHCLHMGCRIARGERLPIHSLNSQIRAECSRGGWLESMTHGKRNRANLARFIRTVRHAAREHGNYDYWQLTGTVGVRLGLMAAAS